MTGAELEELYSSKLGRGPFPYKDCYALQKREDNPCADFIPELDMCFSDIAGYCDSASRLGDRPTDELRRAKKTLAKSFFERFPSLARLESLITAEQTPRLFELMELSEKARLALLGILGTFDID